MVVHSKLYSLVWCVHIIIPGTNRWSRLMGMLGHIGALRYLNLSGKFRVHFYVELDALAITLLQRR